MIKCCYGCTKRWVRDGKTCHSSCKEYSDAVAEDQRRKAVTAEANKGFIAMCEYKKMHYKARDSHFNRGVIPKKNRW